jgi:uncharacterized protein DUF222/HNH endonuclease
MELAGLHAEIDRLEAADLSSDPARLGAEILEIRRAVQRLLAQDSRRLVEFDRLEGYLDAGQTSSKGWLATQTLASRGQAAGQVHTARVRDRLPSLFAAWDAGETTFEHVHTAEVVLRKLPEQLWPEVDEPITVHARVLTAKDFGDWLRRLAQSLGPEPKGKDETQHEMRRLTVSRGMFGMHTLSGRVTDEVAEKLHAALSAASRPDVEGEVRLPNQRTADALESVLDTVLDSGRLPADGGQKPHLTVRVDLDRIGEQAQRDEEAERRQGGDLWRLDAAERAERVKAAAAAADAAADVTSGQPRYYWTGPATAAATRRLACDGIVLPIFTRNGQPIDVGRRTRVISPAMRALITERDQHCRWPGCERPGRWAQCHHVVHWADRGPTDQWNLLLLCNEHHTAAHSGHWTVVLHAPGTITVRRRRSPTEPYYEIRLKAPPPDPGSDVCVEPRTATRARAEGDAA